MMKCFHEKNGYCPMLGIECHSDAPEASQCVYWDSGRISPNLLEVWKELEEVK